MALNRYAMPSSTDILSEKDAPLLLQKLISILENEEPVFNESAELEDAFYKYVLSEDYKRSIKSSISSIISHDPRLSTYAERGSIVIHRSNNFQIIVQSLEASDPPPTIVPTSPGGSMMMVISDTGHLAVDRYKLPGGTDLEVFDKAIRPEFLNSFTVSSGSRPMISIIGDIMDVKIIGNPVIIKLVDRRISAYQWAFSAETLEPLFISASLAALTRFETLIDLMLAFESDGIPDPDCSSALQGLAKHPLHFIRWKAVQGLGLVDPDRAMDVLETFSTDPHPHLRSASQKALSKIR